MPPPDDINIKSSSEPVLEQLAVQSVEDEFVWLELQLKQLGVGVRNLYQAHRKLVLGSAVSLFGILAFISIWAVFLPQSLPFSFAKTESCIISPALFPHTMSSRQGDTFGLSRPTTISVAHIAIFSSQLCAEPKHNPQATAHYKSRQLFSLAGLHLAKTVTVITAHYPAVSALSPSFTKDQATPLIQPIQFKLGGADKIYNYSITANGKSAPCTEQQSTVSCSLLPLQLAYGEKYSVALVRVFHQKTAGTVLSKTIQIISATAVVQTSILADSTVYDKPQQIVLQTNKTLTHAKDISLTQTVAGVTTTLPISSTFKGSTITVTLPELPRQTAFDLHIKDLLATDESQLEQAYDLPFTTSGGPQESAVSISSTGVGLASTITVSFDQPLLASQNAADFVTLSVNNSTVAAQYSISGNKVIIAPASSFPICAHITIQTTNAAQSQYGISGNSAWTFKARAQCYTTYNIGTSVRGRPMTAYQFGSGANLVLYVGGTHGNEQNSSVILQKWIAELDHNPDNIPAGRTITVIPQINPDGLAADSRLNADGIDLNRNFPANNWQTNVTEPGSAAMTTDGGPTPLSEPESQALANFVSAKQPRLVLTYHSHAGIVEANEAGDSVLLAATYAAKAGYKAIPTSLIGTTFDYSTTGAFEDWMKDKLNLPAFVIELTSSTADEFSRNRSAMWAMAQI